MDSSQLTPSIKTFLSDAGIEVKGVRLNRMHDGANNQVFVVHKADKKHIVKIYFSNAADSRDRLGAEYSFLLYAVGRGVKCVPRPIYSCCEKNMGLYEFVEGKKLVSSELSRQHIIEAARFFRAINIGDGRDKGLPPASEACFSIAHHFALVDKRIKKLKSMPVISSLDRQALLFVDEINAAWEKTKNKIVAKSGSFSTLLNDRDRCVSPSDFGFHNALLRDSGDTCFIDFEYAGWDDPAKTVSDFFLQPTVPVNLEYFDLFAEEALAYSPNMDEMIARTRLLFPIFKIKWCCIMLNDFLPNEAKRRQFSRRGGDAEARKKKQLAEAKDFLKKEGLE